MSSTIGFHSALANVLFSTQPSPDRAAAEAELLQRLQREMEQMTSAVIFRKATFIDAVVVPKLSGANKLALAKLIEDRAPAAIENMRNLYTWRSHMRKSHDLEKILRPASLERMLEALRLEEQNVAKG